MEVIERDQAFGEFVNYIEFRSNQSEDQQRNKVTNYLIGIYGAPGTGKSTFINDLARSFKVNNSLKNLVPITVTFNYLSSMDQDHPTNTMA